MLDVEIVKLYNNIKDPAWPMIQSYAEFQQLPDFIKTECDNLHQFQVYKELICDHNHRVRSSTSVCVYKNLAFVPIAKCAYVYHTTMFNNLGWKKIKLDELDLDNTKFFGLVMHPLRRRLKGLTEWIVQSYAIDNPVESPTNPWTSSKSVIDWAQLKADTNTKYFKNLVGSVNIGDLHSEPYSTMFGDFLQKVNWIPMDIMSSDQVKSSMMKFFNLHGHSIELPLNDRHLHVSSPDQLEIFNWVNKICNSQSVQQLNFHKFYNHDLKFYYDLVSKFDPNWQTVC